MPNRTGFNAADLMEAQLQPCILALQAAWPMYTMRYLRISLLDVAKDRDEVDAIKVKPSNALMPISSPLRDRPPSTASGATTVSADRSSPGSRLPCSGSERQPFAPVLQHALS